MSCIILVVACVNCRRPLANLCNHLSTFGEIGLPSPPEAHPLCTWAISDSNSRRALLAKTNMTSHAADFSGPDRFAANPLLLPRCWAQWLLETRQAPGNTDDSVWLAYWKLKLKANKNERPLCLSPGGVQIGHTWNHRKHIAQWVKPSLEVPRECLDRAYRRYRPCMSTPTICARTRPGTVRFKLPRAL